MWHKPYLNSDIGYKQMFDRKVDNLYKIKQYWDRKKKPIWYAHGYIHT